MAVSSKEQTYDRMRDGTELAHTLVGDILPGSGQLELGLDVDVSPVYSEIRIILAEALETGVMNLDTGAEATRLDELIEMTGFANGVDAMSATLKHLKQGKVILIGSEPEPAKQAKTDFCISLLEHAEAVAHLRDLSLAES